MTNKLTGTDEQRKLNKAALQMAKDGIYDMFKNAFSLAN